MAALPQKNESIETAAIVVATMRKFGIVPLPRNYELVYQYLNRSNAALVQQFTALGSHPTQLQLDDIGRKFFPHYHHPIIVIDTNDRVSDEIILLIKVFEKEQDALQRYSNTLDESISGMSKNTKSSVEILEHLVLALSSATGNTLGESEIAVRQMIDRTQELALIKSELDELKRLANIDPVTQLLNRRSFDEKLAAIYTAKLGTKYHALIVADIDRFKKLNDTFGHPVGDRVLSMVATVIKNTLREGTFVARIGGEEFAIILDEATMAGAAEIAERVRLAIESTLLKNQRNGQDYGRITMSFGLCMSADASSAEELYSRADKALYLAKGSGRNCLKIHNSEVGPKKGTIEGP